MQKIVAVFDDQMTNTNFNRSLVTHPLRYYATPVVMM